MSKRNSDGERKQQFLPDGSPFNYRNPPSPWDHPAAEMLCSLCNKSAPHQLRFCNFLVNRYVQFTTQKLAEANVIKRNLELSLLKAKTECFDFKMKLFSKEGSPTARVAKAKFSEAQQEKEDRILEDFTANDDMVDNLASNLLSQQDKAAQLFTQLQYRDEDDFFKLYNDAAQEMPASASALASASAGDAVDAGEKI